MLPAGVAADQMRRARSVSNDPVTALGTFAQNIHIWQSENPEPEPSPIETLKKGGSSLFLVLGIAVVIVLGVAIMAVLLWDTTAQQPSTEKMHFKAPDHVKDLLATIAREREQVNDGELKQVLYQMCVDIEKYFVKSSSDKKRDALFFRDRLTEVTQVLTKYVDVQDNPRYYRTPADELALAKKSITDFSDYVLESIRRGTAEDLFDFRVNTNILQAQRFR